MREYKYMFTVVCAGSGQADEEQVESMIDLAMQDLCYDDSFIEALDEKEAVTIQVSKLGK